MSTINNSDLFLVERAGTSYKVEASDVVDAQSTDLFLANRAGTSYKVERGLVSSKVSNSDLVLVERAGTSYKVDGAAFKALFQSTIQCGTFSPTAYSGGVSNFGQASGCAGNYIRPSGTTYQCNINSSVDLVVSPGDVVTVKCCSGTDYYTQTLILVTTTQTYQFLPNLKIATWSLVCSSGENRSVTISQSGIITALNSTGRTDGSGDVGFTNIEINGYPIYAGSSYVTG